MAAGDSWDSWLILGLAEHLHAASIGVWRPTGAYEPDEIAIINRDIPPTPDTIITLADYPLAGPGRSGLADYLVGVQIRIRGTTDPRIAGDLASELFDLLHESGRQVWGTGPKEVSIVDVYRASYTPLGKDANGRWEASHNYYVEAMRPTIHRSN